MLSSSTQIQPYYRGMYQDCADPAGGCYGDSLPCVYDDGQTYCTEAADRATANPGALVAERWYCVELMLEGGTPSVTEAGANGGLDFWLDGVDLAPNQTHHWMRTSAAVQPNILSLSLFHHDGTHSDEGVDYDDVVVSADRIGCH